MRVKWYIVILLIAIIMVIIAGFFNYTITRSIVIKASVFDTSAQLADLNKWKKWNRGLFVLNKGLTTTQRSAVMAGGGKLNLIIINPASFTIEKQNGEQTSIEFITIQSVKADTFTLAQWSRQERGFKVLSDMLKRGDDIDRQLANLKRFTENPDEIYGFPIRIVEVNDRVLCTVRKLVKIDSAVNQIGPMLNKLKLFLSKNNSIVEKQYYYVSYLPLDGKVELAVALPVTKEAPPDGGFEFLRFPADGRLLVGTYNGAHAGLHNLYAAMDKYMADKHLTKVAQVLEAYPYDSNFKKPMKIRVIYPIY